MNQKIRGEKRKARDQKRVIAVTTRELAAKKRAEKRAVKESIEQYSAQTKRTRTMHKRKIKEQISRMTSDSSRARTL